jgi:hypothetical protein
LNKRTPSAIKKAKKRKTRNPLRSAVFDEVSTLRITTDRKGFRVNAKIRRQLRHRKRRIERRLDKTRLGPVDQPVFTASNIHYEIAERTHGLAHGGIGAIHALARRIGLVDAIDQSLHLLKLHLPYHESDHVLNLAYNALCEGTCLQDLERRRQDEVYPKLLSFKKKRAIFPPVRVASPYSTTRAPPKRRVVKTYPLALGFGDLRCWVSSPRHRRVAHVSSPL